MIWTTIPEKKIVVPNAQVYICHDGRKKLYKSRINFRFFSWKI